MILVEPPAAYAGRIAYTFTVSNCCQCRQEPPPPRILRQDFWTQLVLDKISEFGNEPARITTLANEVAREGNFTHRADYDNKRIELFRLVAAMLRRGLIVRVGRKHVGIPRTDARRPARLPAAAKPADLPPPQV